MTNVAETLDVPAACRALADALVTESRGLVRHNPAGAWPNLVGGSRTTQVTATVYAPGAVSLMVVDASPAVALRIMGLLGEVL